MIVILPLEVRFASTDSSTTVSSTINRQLICLRQRKSFVILAVDVHVCIYDLVGLAAQITFQDLTIYVTEVLPGEGILYGFHSILFISPISA